MIHKLISSRINKNSSISSITSLISLPNEILLLIFESLDIISLLALSDTCRRFNALSYTRLLSLFASPDLTLKFSLNQEYKWQPQVDLSFSHFDADTQNLVFKPKSQTALTFYNSAVLRKPNLCNISLIQGINENGEPRSLKENLLQKSYSLSIKPIGTFQQIHKVYRRGKGTKHMPLSYTFSYTVSPPTEESLSKTGNRERLITLIEFSCPVGFFYPQATTAQKIIGNLFGRRRGKKKVKKLSTTTLIDSKIHLDKSCEQTSEIARALELMVVNI
ncbi:5208_t:CDS:1 [Paraglomus brasilianum]|uniref:5208_t:CDS:1 n=1 Tax=Paraglomus brasilianum TaxID=144538 RepID=A0A9N9B9M9_9GLOM|nr:5208_t:CDS:1 [Paraglomus brasilianum]